MHIRGLVVIGALVLGGCTPFSLINPPGSSRCELGFCIAQFEDLYNDADNGALESTCATAQPGTDTFNQCVTRAAAATVFQRAGTDGSGASATGCVSGSNVTMTQRQATQKYDSLAASIVSELTNSAEPMAYRFETPAGGTERVMVADPDAVSAFRNQLSPLQQYLNCYVGPVDPFNQEVDMLRGHIVTAVLAQYGNLIVEQQETDQRADAAADLLASIRRAALLIRTGSNIAILNTLTDGSPTSDSLRQNGFDGTLPPNTLPTADLCSTDFGPVPYCDAMVFFYAAHRKTAVLQIAIDAGYYEASNLFNYGKNLAGFLTNPVFSLLDAETLVKGALGELKKAGEVQVYGTAFRYAGWQTLSKYRSDNPATSLIMPSYKDWEMWDQRMNAACQSLSAMAGETTITGCTPSKQNMRTYINKEYGYTGVALIEPS